MTRNACITRQNVQRQLKRVWLPQALFTAFAVDEANHVAMIRARLGEAAAGVMPQVRPPRCLLDAAIVCKSMCAAPQRFMGARLARCSPESPGSAVSSTCSANCLDKQHAVRRACYLPCALHRGHQAEELGGLRLRCTTLGKVWPPCALNSMLLPRSWT